ncbi:MAG: hypothetical protein M1357_00070 [Candidatus Marsarchaeota archaeon]|nr:hypothetical protein [Candidatus Marsarchaeota archaeon]
MKKFSRQELENLSSTFPVDAVAVDLEDVERRWKTLSSEHYEFIIPCFTCKFFHECNSGAKHDPVTCDILSEWFRQENVAAECLDSVGGSGSTR